MNIALGAVLLTILLLPPLIIYHAYYSGNHARPTAKFSVPEYVFGSAILSLGLHCAVIYCAKIKIDFELLFRILAGQMTEAYLTSVVDRLPSYFYYFTAYAIEICMASALVGWSVARLISSVKMRSNGWMQKIRNRNPPGHATRYFNSWWYYFRFYEYSSSAANRRNVLPVVSVNLLVETKEACIIYEGILFDWVTVGEALDRVYIKNATRRMLNKADVGGLLLQERTDENFETDVDGMLCVPYSKITNMHIKFESTRLIIADGNIRDKGYDSLVAFINAIKESDLPLE